MGKKTNFHSETKFPGLGNPHRSQNINEIRIQSETYSKPRTTISNQMCLLILIKVFTVEIAHGGDPDAPFVFFQ